MSKAWVPPEGHPDSVVDRLVEYLAPFRPALVGRLRGAPEAEIECYAELAGFGGSAGRLPASYLAFLRRMGHDDGGLLHGHRLRVDLPYVVELYREALADEPWTLDLLLPVVGAYVVGDQVSLDRSTGAAEPYVVESGDGELVAFLSHSWEHLLMQAAVLQVESRRLPIGRWHASSVTSAAAVAPDRVSDRQLVLSRLVDLARRLQLEPVWPSDARCCIAVGHDTSVVAVVEERGDMLLRVFSRAQEQQEIAREHAVHVLGATSGGTLHSGALDSGGRA